MSASRHRQLLLVTCAAIVVLFGYQVFSQLSGYLETCERGGDFSVLLLNVKRASQFEAYVGPYSRYRVAHPGPIVFYWYALVELILGKFASPMGCAMLAQIVLNLFFALCSVGVICKNAERHETPLLLSGLMLILFEATKVPFLHYIWNPAVLLFPCAVLLLAAAAVATRKTHAIFALVFASLVMSHHHIGGAAFAFVIVVVTFLLVLLRRGEKELFSRWYLASYVIGILASLPLLLEAGFEPRFGNIGRVWRHVMRERDAMPFVDSLEFLCKVLSPIDVGFVGNTLLVIGIFGVPWLAYIPNFERNLRTLCTISVLVGLYVVRGLHELTYDYLVWFLHSVTAVQMWLLCVVLMGWLRFPPVFAASAAIGTFAFAAISIVPQSTTLGGGCEFAGRETVKWVATQNVRKFRLQLVGRDAWGAGAAIVNNMVRSGVDLCVDKRWGFMFGKELTCAGDADDRKVLLVASAVRDEGTLIFEGGGYSVMVVDSPSPLTRR